MTSDAITIAFNVSTNYLVDIYWPKEDLYESFLPCMSRLNSYIHITATDESLVTSGANYNTTPGCSHLEAVEKRSSRSPMQNVYQATLTNAPVSVYRNDVLLSNVSSIILLKSEGQWYYDSTAQALYIYTLQKPTLSDVIDAAGGAITGIVAQGLNYITFRNLIVKEFTGPAIVNDSSTNLTYDTLEVKLNGSSGYNIENGTQWVTIIRGSIHNNGWQNTGDRNGVSIGGFGNSSANILIDTVDISGNFNTNVEVAGTDTGAVMSNVTVQNCKLHDSRKSGFKIDGGHKGISLLSNQIHNNSEAGYYTSSNYRGSSTVAVSNNVFSNNGAQAQTYRSNVHVGANNTTFTYNTVGGAADGVAEIDLTESTITSNFNSWVHPSGSTYMHYQSIQTDFYGWQTVSGQDTNSVLVP